MQADEAPTQDRMEQLSPANFKRLAEFIHGYSGIKMPTSKRTMLEGRLRRRVRAVGAGSLDDYCRQIFAGTADHAEVVHLIDAVTTNKTDFFREPSHFDFLVRTALPELLETGRRRIKAWSAACSIGAEAYTLAMVLEEFCAANRGWDYSILGTDLCTQVIGQAVAGRYPEAMIAPVSPRLRQRYVMRGREQAAGEVRIAPRLRAKLAFGRLNLMDEAYPVERDMDLIFCRNILIYFDKPTQAGVLSRLCEHLRPGGYLFLGHSESLVGIDLPVEQIASTVFRRR